jgi:hypothetical protein
MMLFAVMHLLLAAVMVAAPFIANALVSNASAAGGIVMPFVAAASAAGVATIKGAQASGRMPGSAGVGTSSGTAMKLAGSNTNYRTPTMRAATTSFASSLESAPATSSSAQVVASGSSGTGSAPAPKKSAPAIQQRRGAIIRQNMKKG